MQCPFCGQEHEEGARFCPVTGQDLPVETSVFATVPKKKPSPAVWVALGIVIFVIVCLILGGGSFLVVRGLRGEGPLAMLARDADSPALEDTYEEEGDEQQDLPQPTEEISQEPAEQEKPEEEVLISPEEAPVAAIRVGLVTDVGNVDDRSFNQSAWEGLLQAEQRLGAEANYIETRDAKDYATNIALFAEDGYDVIVTVGYALGDATREAADKYPNIDFIGVDQAQSDTRPNLTGLLFDEWQAGFQAGALAGMLTESKLVAGVYGTDLVPAVVAFAEGFADGITYIDASIEVITTYHPGGFSTAFTDPEWGATTAKQAIEQGADVVFAAGGNTGTGALIESANYDGVYCIGVDTDQWETVPEAQSCLVSSAMKEIGDGVFDLIKESASANFPGGNYFSQVGLAPFHDFDQLISQEIKDTLAQIGLDLENGALQYSDFH